MPADAPRCYLILRELPAHLRPAYVWREPGVTVVVNDPRHTRLELAAATMDLITEAEANVHREAFGLPPVGEPMHAEFLDGPALLYVPPGLRLRDYPPLQGGATLQQRREAGTLTEEETLLRLELREMAS